MTQQTEARPDDNFKLAAQITAYLESVNIVVIPAMFKSDMQKLCFILPANEGTMRDFAGALSRAKICDYRAVSFVEYLSDNAAEILKRMHQVFPDGFSIMALDIKDIKVRNIPTTRTDD